jgi:cyclase
MDPLRVIPRLDIKGPNVVKGIQLEGLRVIGSPGELARRYYADGADEIIFMDIVASLYGRNQILSVVEDVARDVFVPLTAGGGIRSLEDIAQTLRSGADKVAINTAAIGRPDFLREAAEAFGSQCIVLSVEAKQRPQGGWEAYTDNGREHTGRNVLDWIAEAEQLGVGEVLITSVDREGTRKGFDLDLLAAVYARVRVPVIACGGAGSAEHAVAALKPPRADAICCASIFHYNSCAIPALKDALSRAGLTVR